MQILFILDPIASLNIKKDSSYAMMREANARGHQIFITEARDLLVRQHAVEARMFPLQFAENPWYQLGEPVTQALSVVDAVIMRKDPPFDMQYLYAAHLLAQAEREGARVFNSGNALSTFNEKLAILRFPTFTAATLVSQQYAPIRAFLAEHQDIIVKPLDGMGGTGIFRIRENDPNIGAILETLTANQTRSIMVQRYIPEIVDGDKRILIIDGKPVDWCLARIPAPGETRGNLASGGTGVARPLTTRDREIAEHIGQALKDQGLLLIGLDVIGEFVTEINVTSPTCFQEITEQSGINVPGIFIDAVERKVAGL
jgi:glutathione synthase